mmetsp:Transcript_27467/g.65960  ORF Transcript_27467/g.65960 Transcript_27467/m.65960 type:complete len:440 (+) Transcript_27467:39-1358(+)
MISLATGLPLLPLLLLSIYILEQRPQHVFCEGLPIPTIIPTRTKTQHAATTWTSIIFNTNRIIRRRSRRDQHRQHYHQHRHHHHQGGGLGIRTTALTTAEMYSSNSDGGDGGGGGMFLTRKNFLRLVQSFLVVTPFLTELYSRLGSMFPNAQLPSGEDLISQPTSSSDGGESSSSPAAVVDWDKIRHITLVFHGAGGQDQYTDELMTNLKKKQEQHQKPNNNNNSKEQCPSSSSSYCQIVEWGDYSTNLFQASYNGEAIGRIVAEYLSPKAKNIETVHLIGISVGAFAANMAATNWQQQQQQTGRGGEDRSGSTASSPPSPPYVQLTLLDPFTQRGIFGIGYGQHNFGSSPSIDYTQQYLNTDDPVPSTNMPIKNAVCYDVTSVRPSEIFGHDWPLAYYAKRLEAATAAAGEKNDNFTEIVALDQRKPPGQVITVTSLD